MRTFNTLFPDLFLNQPRQMLPKHKKNEEWKRANMDYWEQAGVAQLFSQYKRFKKNQRMASGKVDVEDYISSPNNPDSKYIDALKEFDDFSVHSVKFFPLAPQYVNQLTGEFARLKEKVVIKSVDKYAQSEFLERRKQEVIDSVVNDARREFISILQERGIEPDPEMIAQVDEQIRSLPEIQDFFQKQYRDTLEEWATYQNEHNDHRFNMPELERRAFEDSILFNKEVWHIRLKKNDYDFRLESPYNAFGIKSPDTKYYQDGVAAGVIRMMSINEVLDAFAERMTEKQILQLEEGYKENIAVFGDMGYGPGSLYDPSKPPSKQLTNQDIARNAYYLRKLTENPDLDIWDLAKQFDDFNPLEYQGMVRVSEVYWRSLRRIGFLVKKDLGGSIVYMGPVSEDYVITEPPVYDTVKFKGKSADNLIYGEHIDWTWVDEVWRGIKIGGNLGKLSVGTEPIYLDVEPMEFQFREKGNVFKAKLPIIGSDFPDRNGDSVGPIDRVRPYQVLLNLVMNKITDIEIDELGTFLTFNKNTLPKHSLGQSWEKDREIKAIEAARYFKLLPTDKSIANMEGERVFGDEVRVLDASETNRIIGKMQLARFIREEAALSLGFNQERFGQVSKYQTARGLDQNVTASYTQTDYLFIRHSVELMPRVREMMLMADQYYHLKNGSRTVTFLDSKLETKVLELMQGDTLKDLGVFPVTTPDVREVKAKLEAWLFSNNTTTQGLTVFDIARIFESETTNDILNTFRDAMRRAEEAQRAQEEAALTRLREQLLSQERMQDKALAQREASEEADRANARYITEMQNQGNTRGDDSQQKYELEKQKLAQQKELEEKRLQIAEDKIANDRYKSELSARTALENPVAGERQRPIIQI